MEFQAYPNLSSSRKDVRTFLRLQNVLHSTDSIALPATLLGFAGFLVAYQHMTDNDTGRHSVRNFLFKILISMLPLAVLERKILQCADPVRLFARFSVKVLLMHVCFLTLRISSLVFEDVELAYRGFNTFILIAAVIMLPTVFGLRLSVAGLKEHADVFALALASGLVALCEVSALSRYRWSSKWFRARLVEDVILTGSDYIEILAFVPAVWMAFRKDGGSADMQVADVQVSQRRALSLFAFMTVFYSVEDIAHAIDVRKDFPSAALGHLVHYVLLLDFAGFLLAHLADPEKFAALKGSFMSWFSDRCVV